MYEYAVTYIKLRRGVRLFIFVFIKAYLCIVIPRRTVPYGWLAKPNHMHSIFRNYGINFARVPDFIVPLRNGQAPRALIWPIRQSSSNHLGCDILLICDWRALQASLPQLHPIVECLVVAYCTVVIFKCESRPHVCHRERWNWIKWCCLVLFASSSYLQL